MKGLALGAGSGNHVVYGLGDTDEIDLDGQTYTSALNADGNLVLTLSGGGTLELFGVTDVNEDWFV